MIGDSHTVAPIDWWREERAARSRGFEVIAGIDEAGRGPLAGPVVAACVILPFQADLPDVRDSKAMTPLQRDRAFALIQEQAHAVGIGIADVPTIDSINILRASHEAMRSAVESMSRSADVALIDGLPVNPFPLPQIAIVKGDARSASIAAASIIAKVTRDRMMESYDGEYPQYGFASHKGYSTPEHLAKLEEHGACPLHRRSFAPVANLYAQPCLPFDDGGRRQAGLSGEAIAVAHLSQLGWDVLATRYHCRGGELDIIAMDGETLVFGEVKTRRGKRFGDAAEAVGSRKRTRMLAAAEAYLSEIESEECSCRFDVVEVCIGRDGFASVNLIPAAFMAGE